MINIVTEVNEGCADGATFFFSFFYFVLSSLNRYVGFAELRMRLNNNNKIILFCIVFGFH